MCGSDQCLHAAFQVSRTEEDENSCELLEGAEFQNSVRPKPRASWRVVDKGVTQLTMLFEDKCGSSVENETGDQKHEARQEQVLVSHQQTAFAVSAITIWNIRHESATACL